MGHCSSQPSSLSAFWPHPGAQVWITFVISCGLCGHQIALLNVAPKAPFPPISSSTLNLGCLSKKLFLSEVPTEVRSNTKFRVPNPCPDLQCLPSAPQLSTGVTEPPRARLLSMPSQQKDIHPLQSLSAVHAQLQ